MYIPIAFEAAWVLAALVQPNQRASLCSETLLACRRLASSIPLGITKIFNDVCKQKRRKAPKKKIQEISLSHVLHKKHNALSCVRCIKKEVQKNAAASPNRTASPTPTEGQPKIPINQVSNAHSDLATGGATAAPSKSSQAVAYTIYRTGVEAACTKLGFTNNVIEESLLPGQAHYKK